MARRAGEKRRTGQVATALPSTLLHVEQVASRLAIRPARVRRMLREGRLFGVKIGDRSWRIDALKIEHYIARGGERTERCPQRVADGQLDLGVALHSRP